MCSRAVTRTLRRVLSYSRAKFFWGALDVVHSDESPYSQAQTHPMGENALPPGIGVRRAQIVWSRAAMVPPQDAMTTHLDFLNLTNGSPDDTWTDADFTQLEGMFDQFFAQAAGLMSSGQRVIEYRWYRVGPSIVPPNPAIRIKTVDHVGTATSALPPQVATSVTLKTVPRRQWGRMYLPLLGQSALSTDGRFSSTSITNLGILIDAIFSQAVAADFPPVIYSKARGKAYTVETVQIDNVPDVIRSRRFNESTFRHVSP